MLTKVIPTGKAAMIRRRVIMVQTSPPGAALGKGRRRHACNR